jgi:addiction module HigA family antidote
MAIKRKDVEARRAASAGGGKAIPMTHPGILLKQDVLEPLGITAYRLAKEIKVPPNRVTAILAGKRAITAETSIRLSRFLGISPGFWHGMQARYDLRCALDKIGARVDEEIAPQAAE